MTQIDLDGHSLSLNEVRQVAEQGTAVRIRLQRRPAVRSSTPAPMSKVGCATETWSTG